MHGKHSIAAAALFAVAVAVGAVAVAVGIDEFNANLIVITPISGVHPTLAPAGPSYYGR